MKKYLAAALVVLGFNSQAATPDSLQWKLDFQSKKLNIELTKQNPKFASRIMNGDTIQGRLFVYTTDNDSINVYYYYGIGVTRIDGKTNGNSFVIRSNKRVTINGEKTNIMIKYTLYNNKGEVDCQYNGYKKKK